MIDLNDEYMSESSDDGYDFEPPKAPEPDYLNMTLDSGVMPLEMRFSQINSCYQKMPVAYRSFTYINSVIEGVIPPEKYAFAADGTDRGVRLSRWNIMQAMRSVKKFEDRGRHVRFVTARCSPKLVLVDDFYAYVKSLMDEYAFTAPAKLCLEFPRTILYEDHEKVRSALLSMKLLKVGTMLAGCGEKDSPLTPLIDLPFDYVILAPWLTALAGTRSKGAQITGLLSFLRGLPCDIIADGVVTDEQITALNRADCFGYIPSAGYRGNVEHGRLRMPLDEATLQSEENVD